MEQVATPVQLFDTFYSPLNESKQVSWQLPRLIISLTDLRDKTYYCVVTFMTWDEFNRSSGEKHNKLALNEGLPPKKRSCLKTNRAVTSLACPGVIPRLWLDQPIQGTWWL